MGVRMKVVINRCYGGFSLSKEAYEFLGLEWDTYGYAEEYMSNRTDPKLVECVEKLGVLASGNFAKLKVVEIPDDVEWGITDCDGLECVEEVHRVWR